MKGLIDELYPLTTTTIAWVCNSVYHHQKIINLFTDGTRYEYLFGDYV